MLTLFNKFQKKAEKAQEDINLASQEEGSEIKNPLVRVNRRQSEESLKKSIANKLQNYRPLHRESSFTGPNYHN